MKSGLMLVMLIASLLIGAQRAKAQASYGWQVTYSNSGSVTKQVYDVNYNLTTTTSDWDGSSYSGTDSGATCIMVNGQCTTTVNVTWVPDPNDPSTTNPPEGDTYICEIGTIVDGTSLVTTANPWDESYLYGSGSITDPYGQEYDTDVLDITAYADGQGNVTVDNSSDPDGNWIELPLADGAQFTFSRQFWYDAGYFSQVSGAGPLLASTFAFDGGHPVAKEVEKPYGANVYFFDLANAVESTTLKRHYSQTTGTLSYHIGYACGLSDASWRVTLTVTKLKKSGNTTTTSTIISGQGIVGPQQGFEYAELNSSCGLGGPGKYKVTWRIQTSTDGSPWGTTDIAGPIYVTVLP